MKKVVIDLGVRLIPEKDSVIVPFVNGKPVIMTSLYSPPTTGAFFPSTPPVNANNIFEYDTLTAGDVLHFAQYEAIASEIRNLGPHRGRVYVGKPGPLIQENVLTFRIAELKYEKQRFYSLLKDYLKNLTKSWM